jgi:hypothetical protein
VGLLERDTASWGCWKETQLRGAAGRRHSFVGLLEGDTASWGCWKEAQLRGWGCWKDAEGTRPGL